MAGVFPELEGWDEIDHSHLTDKNIVSVIKATHKLVVSLANLRSGVSSQMSYLQNKVEKLQESINTLNADLKKGTEQLNKNLENASTSSAKLAGALNRLTLWGVLVATAGVIVVLTRFLFENQIWPFSL